jgi:hypothetical protein
MYIVGRGPQGLRLVSFGVTVVASDLAPPIRPGLLAAILRGGRIGLHESLLVFVDGMADVEDFRLAGLSKSSFLVLFLGEPDL